MPMRPRSGRSRVVRHRKSCCSSVGAGMLEAEDLAALGLTPDITCLMTPSLPAASIAWKISSTA